jgi:hypothetical protein
LPLIAFGGAACLAAPGAGVNTPQDPNASGTATSRLPTLLQQLQANGGAGLEVFDGSQNQVLAAQDAQGKDVPVSTATIAAGATPAVTSTVAGTKTANTPTPRPEQATPTPRPGTPTPTATPAASATVAPTATPTATPTPSPAPTATATPSGPPTEGGSSGGTPPTE